MRKRFLLVPVLLLLAAGGAFFAIRPAATPVRVWTMAEGDVRAHWVASGQVHTQQATLSASDWAMIREIPVRENQVVKATQLLVRLDNTSAQTRYRHLRLSFDTSQTRMQEAQHYRELRRQQIAAEIAKALAEERRALAHLAAARRGPNREDIRRVEAARAGAAAGLQEATLVLRREQALLRQGAISLATFEAARLAEKIARSRLQEADSRLRQARSGPSADRVAAAQADVERARAGVAAARSLESEMPVLDDRFRAAFLDVQLRTRELKEGEGQLEATELRAPFAGTVSQRLREPGERTGPGQPIVTVVSSRKPWVEANIDEQDARFVKVGMPVTVHVAALGPEGIAAKVTRAGASLETPPGMPGHVKFLRIRAEVTRPVEDLRAGMAAEVEGSVVLATGTLLLPRAAVLQGKDGPCVWGVHRGRTLRVPVKLGVSGSDMVQMLAGPARDMLVVSEGAARLAEGEVVRIVP